MSQYLRVVMRVRTETGPDVHRSAAICLACSRASSPTLKDSLWYREVNHVDMMSHHCCQHWQMNIEQLNTLRQVLYQVPPVLLPIVQSRAGLRHAGNCWVVSNHWLLWYTITYILCISRCDTQLCEFVKWRTINSMTLCSAAEEKYKWSEGSLEIQMFQGLLAKINNL